MTIAVAVAVAVAFLFGVLVGAALVARNSHRLVARLPKDDRIRFARKVAAVARDR